MVADRVRIVRERIAAAAGRAGRDPASIKLIAVSKGHGKDAVAEGIAAGLTDFAENYLQELALKATTAATWHYQGTLQRRKIRDILKYTSSILSVARMEELEEIEKRATQKVSCLIEVNIAREPQKNGAFAEDISAMLGRDWSKIDIRGLMTVPPASGDPLPWFEKLRDLAAEYKLPELSMGMSSDFEAAIEAGATMVRIGTAIFGARNV